MPSSNPSGDWLLPVVDDFPATIAGTLGWTSAVVGTGAANTALSAAAATAALCKMSGGVVSVVGTTATGIAANELLGMTLNNANGVGVQADFTMAIDTAMPTATNAYAGLYGIFDSSGAVTTGNFIGIMFGWNPITNAINIGFMICADTVARLIANTPTAQAVSIPLNVTPALDVPNTVRLRVNTAWTLVGGAVNGVPTFPQIGTSSQLNVYPNLLVPANGIPNVTNGWLGFKMFAIAGTANTGKMITDLASYALPGRGQNS